MIASRFHQKVEPRRRPRLTRSRATPLPGKKSANDASRRESRRPARPSPAHLSVVIAELGSTPPSWLNVPASPNAPSPRPRAAPRPRIRGRLHGGYEVQEKLNLEGAPGTARSQGVRAASRARAHAAPKAVAAQVTRMWTPLHQLRSRRFSPPRSNDIPGPPDEADRPHPDGEGTLISRTRQIRRRDRALRSLRRERRRARREPARDRPRAGQSKTTRRSS